MRSNDYPLSAFLSPERTDFVRRCGFRPNATSKPEYRSGCVMITCTTTGHRFPVSTRAVEMSMRPRYSVTAGSPPVPPRRPEDDAGPTEDLKTVPRDVKKAIEHIRAELAQQITVADLTRVCGVAERTLHKHFQAFVGVS